MTNSKNCSNDSTADSDDSNLLPHEDFHHVVPDNLVFSKSPNGYKLTMVANKQKIVQQVKEKLLKWKGRTMVRHVEEEVEYL